jgi:L-rhamnose-H+ transport protein
MGVSEWTGLILALGAGVIIGSVLVPLKFVKGWAWENSWLIFSACAYLLSPWVVAICTVPRLPSVYSQTHIPTLVGTLVLGCCWGLAVVLLGLAFDLVGLSISTVLLYGSSVALGSLGALVLVEPAKILSSGGLEVLLWDFVLVGGVVLCARGSALRGAPTTRDRLRIRRGIAISILAGIFSTFFNLALAYGAPIEQRAIALGANPNFAANAIWSLAVSAGSLPSLIWCSYLLRRNNSWRLYRQPKLLRNWLWCISMGVAWICGTVLYGASATQLGRFGAAVAWPIQLSAVIMTGNAWGLAFGEWAGAPRRALNWLWGGVALQILSIVLLSTVRVS